MTALTHPADYVDAARAFLADYATDPRTAMVTEEEGAPVREWAATIDDALDTPGRPAALRSWLVYVHETYGVTADVETLQARFGTRDFDDAIGGVWIPGPRQFTRTASAVQFHLRKDPRIATDFSTRYFSGLRAVASSPTVWVGFSPEARTVIVYRVQEG